MSASVEDRLMSASIKDDRDHVKELLGDIKKLEFEPALEHCIYRVPKNIREINEKDYSPQLVSIGPFHHGKKELADMEKHKKRYVKGFLEQITSEAEDEILSFVQENEKRIRHSYAETSELKSDEFIVMIICDAIFIIELFKRKWNYYESGSNENDLLIVLPAVSYALWLDLLLLENQLPYFVIEEIHNLAFGNTTNMIALSRFFFQVYSGFGDYTAALNHVEVGKHFTDFLRNALVINYPIIKSNGWKYKDVPCAVKLHESGVKFKLIEGNGLLDIRLEKRKWLIPRLEVLEVQIPHLGVCDDTECIFRNIMALEQCLYPLDTRACDYAFLMDRLINSEKDVDFLVRNRIIFDYLADNASIANMFNNLGLQIHSQKSSYAHICNELQAHYNNRWNHAKGTLKGVYFSNIWRGTATIAAIVLLLLTVIQTICSIKQVI